MKTVRLVDYQSKLQEEMPGIWLRDAPGGFGVVIGFDIRTTAEYGVLPLPDPEFETGRGRLAEYLSMLSEQVRIRAIRELGLQPRLDAWAREIRQFQDSNRTLAAQLKEAKDRIIDLETQLAERDAS